MLEEWVMVMGAAIEELADKIIVSAVIVTKVVFMNAFICRCCCF